MIPRACLRVSKELTSEEFLKCFALIRLDPSLIQDFNCEAADVYKIILLAALCTRYKL